MKCVHVSCAYVEASGHESKINSSEKEEHAFPSFPQCHRGKEVGLGFSKLSRAFVPLDPLLLPCVVFTPPPLPPYWKSQIL